MREGGGAATPERGTITLGGVRGTSRSTKTQRDKERATTSLCECERSSSSSSYAGRERETWQSQHLAASSSPAGRSAMVEVIQTYKNCTLKLGPVLIEIKH